VKRFASAAAVAVGLHLILLNLDFGRGGPSIPRLPSIEAVTIDLNAASPRTGESHRLSQTPEPALPPPAGPPVGIFGSENPPDRTFEPKPANSTERKAPPSRARRKTAFQAPAQQSLEATAPLVPDSLDQPGPGSSSDDALPEAEGGRLPGQAAGGQAGAGLEPSMGSGPAVAASQVMLEATPAYDQIPPPEYPKRARQLGFEGTVVLNVSVNPSGGVDDVKIAVSSGYSLLDQSALRSVRTWRFKPARRGDQPVASWVRVPVRYTLEPPGGRMP
jgi:protein TonB